MSLHKIIIITFSLIFFTANTYSRIKKVTVLHTSDIHARIKGKHSGWLKLATLIKKERKKAGGKDKTLLIDCGDTLQGSFAGSYLKGELSVKMLNLLQYDTFVIGNHDFDFGLDILKKRCKEINADCMAGNLYWGSGKQPLAWRIYKKNGARIAVIGMTFPYLYSFIWKEKIRKCYVKSVASTLKKIIPAVMKAKPDSIILAIHSGLFVAVKSERNGIYKLINKYPQIDLVLGGHTHQKKPGESIGRSSWYSEPGKHAEAVVKLELTIDTEKHRTVSISSKILTVNKRVNEDKAIYGKIKHILDRVKRVSQKNVVISKIIIPKSPKGKYNYTLAKFVAEAVKESAHADAAFQGLSNHSSWIDKYVSEKDLYYLAPYEDTIGVLWLNGDEFRSVFAEQQKVKGRRLYQLVSGLSFKTNSRGKIIGRIRLQNNKIWNERQRIKIAFNSYILANPRNKFPILKSISEKVKSKHTGIRIRDAIRKALLKQRK